MAASLTEFLTSLLQDPEGRLRAFQDDKVGTMTAAGVSPEDQDAILSGDRERIEAAVGPEFVAEHEDEMMWFM